MSKIGESIKKLVVKVRVKVNVKVKKIKLKQKIKKIQPPPTNFTEVPSFLVTLSFNHGLTEL